MSRDSFNDCVLFHLLTAFPINAAEKEKYYISNVLKKPQRVNARQFERRVEQLNAYISQMPCFYYSLNANASTKPENVPFTEAELGACVLHMCPLQWQDQYNMNEKGMMLMDMCLLLTSLEVIECVCTYEKGKLESSEKSSHKSKNARLLLECPRRFALRSIVTCARSMGARIRTTHVSVVRLKKMERRNLISVPLRRVVRKVIS
jgi:hypothetical protein